MDDGDGEGNVSMTQFKDYATTTNSGLEKVNRALWGSEGTTGIVKDIHDLKNQSRLLDRIGTVTVGVISAIITALIIKFIGGI